jgi:hypothetical protein
MRRIRSVIAVACMALLLVAFAAVPAMAQGHNNNNNNNGGDGTDRHLERQDVRLDRQLLNDNDDFFVSGAPLFFSDSLGFDNSCPFWGDNVGIVNQWDCLH